MHAVEQSRNDELWQVYVQSYPWMTEETFETFEAFKKRQQSAHVEYTEISDEEIIEEFGPILAAEREKGANNGK